MLQMRKLLGCQRTIRRLAWDVRELCRADAKGILDGDLVRIVGEKVVHEAFVLCNLPVYAVGSEILDVLFLRQYMVEAARSILKEAEEIHFPGTLITGTANLHDVVVPRVCKLEGIFINGREEEIVKQPDVRGKTGIETTVGLQVDEEVFPLLAESVRDIVPQSLYSSIVDTPGTDIRYEYI